MQAWPFQKGATIGSVLGANRGLGPGFDYVRLGLALIIFNVHAGAMANGRAEENLLIVGNTAARALHQWQSWREPIYTALVPAFFAVSGFLVTSSAFRLRSVRSFMAFRALRIFPALSIEVTLSALALGPIFTNETLGDYFTDPKFFRYFGNIAGFVSYFLPGVFAGSPVPRIVNNNLWTLPPEFYCYLVMAFAMATALIYRRSLYTTAFILVTVLLIPYAYRSKFGMYRGNLELPVIVYYFFCGCLVFHWKDRIRMNGVSVVLAGLFAYGLFRARYTVMVAPLFLTYFIVGLGMIRWPHLPLIKKGDYSYGIYLYGFPLTQALAASFPSLTHHSYVFRACALTVTASFAAASWHVFEKPALRLKAYLVASPAQLPPRHDGA